MAQLPSTDEIREYQAESAKQEQEKVELQKEEGKEFNNTGAGVIPEDIWKGHKS